MRKLGWISLLVVFASISACEKAKPAGKTQEHKDGDGHEHKEGDKNEDDDGHEHKDGEKHDDAKK